jgi:hypothetical protein
MKNIEAVLIIHEKLASRKVKVVGSSRAVQCPDKSLRPVLERTGTALWAA